MISLTFFFIRHFYHKSRRSIWLQNSTRIRKHDFDRKSSWLTLVLNLPNSSTYYRWWRQINPSKCYLEIFRKEAWIVWKKSKGRSKNRYANSNGWRYNAGFCPKSLWSQFCKLCTYKVILWRPRTGHFTTHTVLSFKAS